MYFNFRITKTQEIVSLKLGGEASLKQHKQCLLGFSSLGHGGRQGGGHGAGHGGGQGGGHGGGQGGGHGGLQGGGHGGLHSGTLTLWKDN